MKHLLCFIVLSAMFAGPARAADPVLGLWLSPPDHKGQTGHLELAHCGSKICGTLLRAFDKADQPTITLNVGKQLLWDMVPDGANLYRGRVYVPLMNGDFPAEVRLNGNKLTVQGCNKVGLCKAQTWRRVN